MQPLKSHPKPASFQAARQWDNRTVGQWRFLHSDGDKDLANFLGKEIKLEEVKVPALPKIKDFSLKIDGTAVTLEQVHEKERIQVVFNIKDNVRVEAENFNDYLDDMEGCVDIVDYDDPEDVAALFKEFVEDWAFERRPCRYPMFRVYMRKPSGSTLCFHCSLNTDIDEESALCEGVVTTDIGEENFLLVTEVQVYKNKNADGNMEVPLNTYTGRFKPRRSGAELQAMLINSLLERGIDGAFVNNLAELASAIEHRHYVGFMKSLREYVGEE